MTGALWSKLHHGRLPANFGQSEATFVFTLRWRHSKNVKLKNISLPEPQLGYKMQQTNIKTRLGQEMLPDLLALVTLSDTPNNGLDFVEEMT